LFTIVDDTRYPGENKASTLAYIYSIQLDEQPVDQADPEVIAWHWHPRTTPDRPTPHVHVRVDHDQLQGTLSKMHLPTGRVSFEEVIRFLIDDLDVIPARPGDWEALVRDSEDRFRAFRTWS
jgi:hypothetical protein